MMSYKRLFVLLLLSSPLIATTPPIEDFAPLAEQYRLDSSKSEVENDLSRLHVLEEFSKALSPYSGDTIEAIVRAFFADFKGEEAHSYTLIDIAKIGMNGRSSDSVYLLKDPDGVPRFAVKVFTKPFELKGKLMRELASLLFLAELKLPYIHPIQIFSLGMATHENVTYGLMLEEAAPGKRMDQYLYDLAVHALNSSERVAHLETAKKAVHRMATALASLHSIKSDKPGPLHSTDIKKFEKRLRKALENPVIMAAISREIGIEPFLAYVESVRAKGAELSVFHTYLHGSTHFGNVFYDEQTDVITFIDTGAFVRSFDRSGGPLMSEFIDLLRPERDFYKKGTAVGLSEQELDMLKQEFYYTYEESLGPIDADAFEFFKVSEVLRNLHSYSDYTKQPDPSFAKLHEILFNNNINYFINKIKLVVNY